MGIKVNYDLARARLRDAVSWADSDKPVPQEWEERSALVGEAPAITYTPMLGTGLLARATDDRLDALALKATSGPNAYSARGLCTTVLVPMSVDLKFSLRTPGREPLNSQPFFRYDRVDLIERTSFPDALQYLEKCLVRANELNSDESMAALAAFVRVCIRRTESSVRTDFPSIAASLRAVLYASKELLRDSEGGKRAQAVTAAAFDVVFGAERTKSLLVNNPSRQHPGDVLVFGSAGKPIVSAEVRTKSVSKEEIEGFAVALTENSILRGMVVALSPRQERLDAGSITAEIARTMGLLMTIFDSIDQLLVAAFAWSDRNLSEILSEFSERVAERLRGVDASIETQKLWSSLIST